MVFELKGRWRTILVHLGAVVVTGVCVAVLGIHWSLFHHRTVLIQPVHGVALAWALLFGPDYWPGILVGGLVGNLWHETPLVYAAVRAIGFVAQAEIGAVLLRRLVFDRRSQSNLRTVAWILAVAPLVSTIGASFGVVAFALSRIVAPQELGEAWFICWISATLGVVVVTPIGLSLPQLRTMSWTLSRALEAVVLFALVFVSAILVFSSGARISGLVGPFAFLPLPFLFWAAVRFGQTGAGVATLTVVILMAGGTVLGYGPFADHPPLRTLVLTTIYPFMCGIGPLLISSVCEDLAATQAKLRTFALELEQLVEQRTGQLVQANEELRDTIAVKSHVERQLAAANLELESFAYSVSHDLRAPLRHIAGFANALLEDHNERLDDGGRDLLFRIDRSTSVMSQLIDDLLKLSRLSRQALAATRVDLSQLSHETARQLQELEPERKVRWLISDGLSGDGDAGLLQILISNLLGNAWKYTSREEQAVIEVGQQSRAEGEVFYVRDNGVGFDMAFARNLFTPFHRLHARHEFPGSGIGLATVKRIIARHGGSVWIESEVNRGTTVWFQLGPSPSESPSGSTSIVTSPPSPYSPSIASSQ